MWVSTLTMSENLGSPTRTIRSSPSALASTRPDRSNPEHLTSRSEPINRDSIPRDIEDGDDLSLTSSTVSQAIQRARRIRERRERAIQLGELDLAASLYRPSSPQFIPPSLLPLSSSASLASFPRLESTRSESLDDVTQALRVISDDDEFSRIGGIRGRITPDAETDGIHSNTLLFGAHALSSSSSSSSESAAHYEEEGLEESMQESGSRRLRPVQPGQNRDNEDIPIRPNPRPANADPEVTDDERASSPALSTSTYSAYSTRIDPADRQYPQMVHISRIGRDENAPNSGLKNTRRKKRGEEGTPTTFNSGLQDEEDFLDRINQSDRMLAKKSISLFGLSLVENLYSKDWRDRVEGFRELSNHLHGVKKEKARESLEMAIPFLVHGLGDKLFSVGIYL